MLPVILLAAGAYLIGKAVLDDDKYAEGGMTKGQSEWAVTITNKDGDTYDWDGFAKDEDDALTKAEKEAGFESVESGVTMITDASGKKIDYAKGGMMAKGGNVRSLYKQFNEEKPTILLIMIADDVASDFMRKKFDKTIDWSKLSDSEKEKYNEDYRVNKKSFENYLMSEFVKLYYSDESVREKCKGSSHKTIDSIKSVMVGLAKKYPQDKLAKGGKLKQKFEYVNWQDISDDPKDNNKGFIYGINLIDEESAEVVDVEWFKTESLRDKAIKKYDLEEYEFESEMAKGGKLVGKQKNLDVNKNGKLDAEDFKMLRKSKL